ncbi:PD-(D/E)XK nuclease family protein [uncultured Methylobacterium sp.]|jgi:hypothetical protein|uniref:PD-(D/E)XK nuclease family protein n=1 Tax=uncultured Methylobacterium sp. TaxID=157278 RepID=UPI002620C0FA|nr:PD-(D/E)XK nuclease family protein [uncultured Methylobacterium sp.]
MEIIEHTAGRVAGPGLYRMPAEAYHADPCPAPSLSSSIAKLLVEQSPAHAHAAHPRLGKVGQDGNNPTRPKEIGAVAHKLILGQGVEVVAIDADDYTSGKVRLARAEAYGEGKTPILNADRIVAERLAQRVEMRLAAVPGCSGFFDAPAEVVGVIRHRSGAWLRTMMDRVEIHATHAVIWDVKTGDVPAAPHTLGRRIVNMGMEVQAALYVRVLETLLPHLAGRVTFRWIFVENEAPNALVVAEADATTLGIGGRKLALALDRWNTACAKDSWPGYPAAIIRPEFPAWAEAQWQEREEREDAAARDRGEPLNWDVAASPFRPLGMGEAA